MSEIHSQLLTESKLFAAEAIKNAVEANDNCPDRWPLALLHVVTSFELAAKALLAKQHPLFVRERIDVDEKTVSLQTAFQRLQNVEIYGLHISDKDRQRITSAIKIRNGIAHGGGRGNVHAMEAKFFEVFAYLRDFFRFHLETKIMEAVDVKLASALLSIGKQLSEIQKRALGNIKCSEETWQCPDCLEKFLIDRETNFVCLFCLHEEPFFSCEKCEKPLPEHDAFECEELFLWEFSEGRAELVSDYGIVHKKVCKSCFEELGKLVDEAIQLEAIEMAEEEYAYFMQRALAKDPY